MQESDNVLRIFQEARVAMQKGDGSKLRSLSDQTINTASRTQDPDNVTTAVIVYALSKIVERRDYRKQKGWNVFYESLSRSIDKLIKAIEEKKDLLIKKNLEEMRRQIKTLSGDLKNYIEDVFRRSKVNKASRIYAHGISSEKTAKLLGITLWELQNYAGASITQEDPETRTITAKERINTLEEFFK
ncbi:hypothetical protein KAR91_63235 [Candidatus Pacearchaeota archaeon]|nr:hypothetical protein [Candidatus Pacearchaeota archaeon]